MPPVTLLGCVCFLCFLCFLPSKAPIFNGGGPFLFLRRADRPREGRKTEGNKRNLRYPKDSEGGKRKKRKRGKRSRRGIKKRRGKPTQNAGLRGYLKGCDLSFPLTLERRVQCLCLNLNA